MSRLTLQGCQNHIKFSFPNLGQVLSSFKLALNKCYLPQNLMKSFDILLRSLHSQTLIFCVTFKDHKRHKACLFVKIQPWKFIFLFRKKCSFSFLLIIFLIYFCYQIFKVALRQVTFRLLVSWVKIKVASCNGQAHFTTTALVLNPIRTKLCDVLFGSI